MVKRTVRMPGIDKIYGIIIKLNPNDKACEVLWPGGFVSLPFKTKLEVISESR